MTIATLPHRAQFTLQLSGGDTNAVIGTAARKFLESGGSTLETIQLIQTARAAAAVDETAALSVLAQFGFRFVRRAH